MHDPCFRLPRPALGAIVTLAALFGLAGPTRGATTGSWTMGFPYQIPPPALATIVAPMSAFLNTLGINLHSPDFSGYGTSSLYLPKLYAAGWKHVRTNYNLGDGAGTNGVIIRDLAAHGVAVSITSEGVFVNDGCYNNGAGGDMAKCAKDFVNDLVNSNTAGSVAEILGPNEINGNYTDWQALIPQYMAALHTAFKGNQATSHIKIVAPNFNAPDQTTLFRQLGNISADIDAGDIHSNGGYCGSSAADIVGSDCWFKLVNNNESNVAGTNLPYQNTENGWSDGVACAGWPPQWNPAPPWANALMQTRHYFEMFRWNVSYNDVYELINEGADGCYENDFGFLDQNGNPKLQYSIFMAFSSLLADTGTATVTPLPYSLTGTTPYTRSLLLQKTNGSYWLAVWEQQEVWVGNQTPKHLVSPLPPKATLTLTVPSNHNFKVYTPVGQDGTGNGTRVVDSASNGRSLSVVSQAGVTLVQIN